MHSGKFDFLRFRRRFRHPLISAKGPIETVDRIIIRIERDSGVGYGEVAPWPGFPTESCDEVLEILRSARGNLTHLNGTVEAARASLPCLSAALSSCRYWSSIAAFDRGLPCAALLTRPTAESVAEPLAQGYRTLKLKLSESCTIAEISALMDAASEGTTFRLDANGKLSLEQARDWVNFARNHRQVEFLEQPLAVGHYGYASLGTDKIALDESFLTPSGHTWAGPIVVKPSLVGDWDTWLNWRKTRLNPVVYSSAFETVFGRQAALWLAAQDTAIGTVGFDTLRSFIRDGRDRHEPGPIVYGRSDFDWATLWNEMA